VSLDVAFQRTPTDLQKILNMNLKSGFLACQILGKAMVDSGRGASVSTKKISSRLA
jgi:acetolactate synthase regulatory subunit